MKANMKPWRILLLNICYLKIKFKHFVFSSHLVLMIIQLAGFRPVKREGRSRERKVFEEKVKVWSVTNKRERVHESLRISQFGVGRSKRQSCLVGSEEMYYGMRLENKRRLRSHGPVSNVKCNQRVSELESDVVRFAFQKDHYVIWQGQDWR